MPATIKRRPDTGEEGSGELSKFLPKPIRLFPVVNRISLIIPTKAINRDQSKSKGRKRERSLDRDDNDRAVSMDVDDDQPNKKMRLNSRSLSRSRSKSRPPGEVVPGEDFKDTAQKKKAIELAKKSVKKRNKDARKGEADRVIPTLKPKHLFSSKRSTEKTQRR